jgi:hypothetical protein
MDTILGIAQLAEFFEQSRSDNRHQSGALTLRFRYSMAA